MRRVPMLPTGGGDRRKDEVGGRSRLLHERPWVAPCRSRLLPATFGLSLTALALLLFALSAPCQEAGPKPRSQSTVGMPAKIEQLVLPGPELESRPIEDRRAPVVVRIAAVYPHGTAFRYDIVYYGLEPGRYDLRDYLRRKDGSPTKDVPSLPVVVEPVLPPGQIEPHRLPLEPSPSLGGYRGLAIAGGVAWIAGLVAIALAGRRKRALAAAATTRPLTLADRLRPLVDAAMAGTLGEGQKAELERLLIGYWRKRLGLERTEPARVMAMLREDDEAGPLLRRLEDWLHRPPGEASEPVDVAALLKPYQSIPAEDPEPSGMTTTASSSAPGPSSTWGRRP